MARLLSLALLSYVAVVTLGHNYGPSRMNRPGFYASEPTSLEPAPQEPSPPNTNEPAAPPMVPTQTNPAPAPPPQMEAGFQPSLQRGTKKFVDNVRQGLVQGLEEFLGIPGGGQPHKPTSGSSVTYADPSTLSYHAPTPFIYGSRQPTPVVGYQQTRPRAPVGGPPNRYSSQSLGSGTNTYGSLPVAAGSYVAQPQQAPAVTHWFRQDHSGRNAPLSNAATIAVPQYATYQ